MEDYLRAESSNSSIEPPNKKSKRNVNHVSRACDRCRKRKTRCNGGRPACDACDEKGLDCEYHEEDKRKTNTEMEELRSRLAKLERLLRVDSRSPSHRDPPLFVPQTSQSPHQRRATSLQLDGEEVDEEGASPSMTFGWADPFRSAEDVPRAFKILPKPIRRHTMVSPIPFTQRPPAFGTGDDDSDRVRRETDFGSREQAITLLPSLEAPSLDGSKRSTGRPFMQSSPSLFRTNGTFERRDQLDPLSRPHSTLFPPPIRPGDWVDWARYLPPISNLTKEKHDDALEYFAAYYAPWCMIVDMTAFLREMNVVNLVSQSSRNTMAVSEGSSPASSSRSPNYSPLLHNTVFYLGMYLLKDEWPDCMVHLEKVFMVHCTELLQRECDSPSLSTLRALNLLSSCQSMKLSRRSALNTGYIYYGLAFAAVQALGVNLNSDRYVRQGQMTEEERDLRDAAYWTMSIQDVLRAIAAGRPPMLADSPDIAYPKIDAVVDEIPWFAPSRLRQGAAPSSPGMSINGVRGLRSTVFHWTVRLGMIIRGILGTMYSVRPGNKTRDESVMTLSKQLDQWHSTIPLPVPEVCPLPHILLLHMLYNSAIIFLHRPFYRNANTTTFSPTQKCDHAAEAMMHLLRTFDSIHGVRNGPMTLITNTFAVSTIFLLRSVCLQGNEQALKVDIANVDECVTLMSRLALIWDEAHRGLDVLISMRNEWLPSVETLTTDTNSKGTSRPPAPTNNNDSSFQGTIGDGTCNDLTSTFGDGTNHLGGGSTNGDHGNNGTMGELPSELQEWLMSQDLLDVMFPNGGMQYGGDWGTMQ